MRADLIPGGTRLESAPHQVAIQALAFELQEARDEEVEEPGSSGYTMGDLRSLEKTIELLCQLRDGETAVHRTL